MMIEQLPFGRTGHLSTRTLFGAAAFGEVSQKEADQGMEVLLQYGVNHIDTAADYGEAETRIGPWMKNYRKHFFLATKTGKRTYQEARESIHRSLERLQTDWIDLLQLHAVVEETDWSTALGPGGALEAIIEARQKEIAQKLGYELTDHGLYLYGFCPQCRKS